MSCRLLLLHRQAEGVPLLDANSGFEPRTFDEEAWRRWKPINRGPWRFAMDDQGDVPHELRVLELLRDRVTNSRKKIVYVLIGNEPLVRAWSASGLCWTTAQSRTANR